MTAIVLVWRFYFSPPMLFAIEQLTYLLILQDVHLKSLSYPRLACPPLSSSPRVIYAPRFRWQITASGLPLRIS